MEKSLVKQQQTNFEKDFKPLLAEINEQCSVPIPVIENKETEKVIATDALQTRSLWERLEKKRKYFVDPLSDLIRIINKIASPHLDALKAREVECDSAIRSFRKRQEEDRQKQEAEARAAVERENERIRKEREAKAAKIEAAAAKLKDEQAAELKRMEAERIRSNVIVIPPPVIVSEKTKLENITIKKIWKCRITDAAAVPHQYRKCEPNMSVLNALAKSSGAQFQGANSIAGVEFYCEETFAKSGTKGGDE